MQKEFQAFQDNHIWDIVPYSDDVKLPGWVYTIKLMSDGSWESTLVWASLWVNVCTCGQDDHCLHYYGYWCLKRVVNLTNKCEKCIFVWRPQRRDLHDSTWHFHSLLSWDLLFKAVDWSRYHMLGLRSFVFLLILTLFKIRLTSLFLRNTPTRIVVLLVYVDNIVTFPLSSTKLMCLPRLYLVIYINSWMTFDAS